MKAKVIEMKGKTMLPAGPGKCPECAVEHEPEMTHDKRSMFYQMKFHQEHGRWPTWEDAMAHCTPEMKATTIEVLTNLGVMKE